MTVSRIATTNAPAAVGPYSQGVSTGQGAGSFVFVSGQVPLDPATGALVEGDIQAQAEQVLKNVGAILAEAGLGYDDVVKTTVLLADIADFAAVNEVYARYFTGESAAARPAVMMAQKDSSERIPPRRMTRGRRVGGIVFLSCNLDVGPGRLVTLRPPAVPHPYPRLRRLPWGEQHGAPSTRGHPVDVEPGKSLVNGSPHRQGQTPRAGGGGAPSDAAGPVRTCGTDAGLASVGVASVTALDRTSSGPGRLRTGRRWPRSRRRPPAAGRQPRRRPGPGGSRR